MSQHFGRALTALMICATAFAQEPRVDDSQARALYRKAIAESERAATLERKGKKIEAIEAYESAGQICETALSELDTAGTPLADRSPDVYYRCATSYLHAGRLLAQLRREGPRQDEDLRKAVIYLDLVQDVEKRIAQRENRPINPEIWRVHNAAGYACFLRGELAQARQHYQTVLEMNPTYEPAARAIAQINKLERDQNEVFSPQGRTARSEKTRKMLRDTVDTLKLVRDIVTLGL